MTTFSTRGVAGAPQPPPGRKFIDDIGPVPTEEAGAAAANPIVPSGATPSAMTAAATAHSNALQNGASPKQALTVARVAAKKTQTATSPNEPPGFIPTGKVRQQTPDESKAYEDENTIGKQLTVAETAAQHPTAASDATLGSAFARAQIGGRLTNFDLQRFNNLGSARMRMEGDISKGVDGTMTDEQRNMLLSNMRVNYQAAHGLAENYRKGAAGVGQRSSAPAAGTGGAAAAAPSADDLESLFQKAKAH
jgi:opacity protein-like surface antigen